MKKAMERNKKFMFSTSIENVTENDEFLVEITSYSEKGETFPQQKTMIHNFDELINFIECNE